MSIEIRNPTPEEYAGAVEALSTTFLDRPEIERVAAEVRKYWPSDRMWVAWDGARACGTFRSWGTELTLPGGRTLPTAAVTAVTVLPTHRRRGILTQMARTAHARIAEQGEPLAVLIASEYPIYGRFGYAPATRDARMTVRNRSAELRGEPSGTIEFAPLGPATRDAMRTVYNAARLRVAGEMWRRDLTWDVDSGVTGDLFSDKRWSGFVVLHRSRDGELDGYARYTAEEHWDHGPDSALDVADLHALNDAAYADLWRFLLNLDLVTTVRAEHRPRSERLPWLFSDARAARFDMVADRQWLRLLDVPRAFEGRAYEACAALVLEVVGDELLGGTRRWRLDASPDGATCAATDATPDLTVPAAALGGAYLGGTRLRDVVLMTGVDEHRRGALAEADALLRTADEPWCSTSF